MVFPKSHSRNTSKKSLTLTALKCRNGVWIFAPTAISAAASCVQKNFLSCQQKHCETRFFRLVFWNGSQKFRICVCLNRLTGWRMNRNAVPGNIRTGPGQNGAGQPAAKSSRALLKCPSPPRSGQDSQVKCIRIFTFILKSNVISDGEISIRVRALELIYSLHR